MAFSDSIRTYDVSVVNGQDLAKALLAEVHREAEIKTSDNTTHIKLDEIKVILESIDKNLKKEMDDLEATVKKAGTMKRGPGAAGGAKPAAKTGEVKEDKTPDMTKLTMLMGKTYSGLDALTRAMTGASMKAQKAAIAAAGGGGGGGGGVPNPANLNKASAALAGSTAAVNFGISKFTDGLSKMGLDVSSAYRGAASDAMTHVQDMRAIIYETQGAGVAMTNMEKQWIDLGRAATETGMMQGQVATIYRKELQKGLTTEIQSGKVHQRVANDQLKLVKNSLRTANLLGMSAESTAEMFGEWNRHLGLTNEQLGFVGREMEQVAKNSGVTGDDLLRATKAASILVKEVRNFAGISAQAMSQIIQTQTSLEKFGATDIGAKFNQAMSQGIRTLSQAEPAIASIIAESAQRAGVSMTGSMLTGGAQQRKMQKEIMRTLEGRLASIGMGGVNPAELLDKLEEMRDKGMDTGLIEQQIKNVTGMGAGELQNLYKAYQESSMSFQDRMKKFEDRIANATTPEGRALAERQKADFQKQDQRQQLSTFSDMLGRGGSLETAIQNFNNRMQREGRADAMLTGPDAAAKLAKQGVTDLAERGKAAGVDINAALKKRGLTQEGLQRGLLDPKSSKEFAAILQEVENEVLTQEKANQDPVAKASLELKKINEKLFNATTRLYMAFMSFELIMGAAVALLAAKAGTSLMSLSNITGMLGKGGPGKLGKLFGFGGKAAGKVGGAAAAEAGLVGAEAVAGKAAGGVAAKAAGGAAAKAAGGAAAGRAGGGLLARAGGGLARMGGGLGRAAVGVGSKVAGVMGLKVGAKVLGSGAAKVAGLALGASNPIGWVVTLATALGGGFVNALEAASKATEIFNVSQEKLTYTQKAAAKSAGFLTGVLDFITFGLFSDYIGPTGSWTKALAHFFDEFWPLALLGDTLLKPFELLWAVIKGIGLGIWEYWKGLYDGFMAVWKPINDALNELKTEILVPISAAFSEVFGVGADSIDIMQSISDALKWVGKQFGDLARWIGGVLGQAIRMFTPMIKEAAKWIASYLVPAVKALFTFFKGVWQVISGIFTLDGDKIWTGLKNIFAEAPKLIWQAIQGFVGLFVKAIPVIIGFIWDCLKKAFNWLTTDLPRIVWDALKSAFSWLTTDLPSIIWNALKTAFNWLITDLPKYLAQGFMWIVTGVGDLLKQGFNWLVNDLPTIVKDAFMGAINAIWDWIKSKIPGAETVTKAASGYGEAFDQLKQGNLWTATKGAFNTTVDTGKSVANGITNNAITRGLGIDFELFDIGSMGITQDGLAYLHKGEMVVPAESAGAMFGKATSKGEFKGNTVFGSMARSISNALGLGLFDNNQGKEATDTGLSSWVNQLMSPFSTITDGIGSMFSKPKEDTGGGGFFSRIMNMFKPQQPAPAAAGGTWIDRMLEMLGLKKPKEEKKASMEDYMQALVDIGKASLDVQKGTADVLNSGLFDKNVISDAVYETSVQSSKEYDSMFGGDMNADNLEQVVLDAQEVLMGDLEFPEAKLEMEVPEPEVGPSNAIEGIWTSVKDMGLFAGNTVKEALDAMNSQPLQQRSLWDSAMDAFDNIWNNPKNDPYTNNQPTLWDRAVNLWDNLTGKTEKGKSNPMDTGLFAASNVKETFWESMKNGISNSPIGRLADMFGFGGNTTTASTGNSLYYNKESEYQSATTQTPAGGSTTNNYVNAGRRVRGLPVKGRVSSNLLNSSGDVEDYIIQRQLLDQPSGGGGTAAGTLERIADAVEGVSLEQIITLLEAIRDKDMNVLINARGGSGNGGAPSVENSSLREGYNRAWLNGDWTHIADPDYSDNANILGTSR